MLKIEHVSKTFNKGTVNEKTAIDDLSLTVNDGDFITIVGSNGAGKSTLINVIAGDFPVDSGSIILDKQDITRMAGYKRSKFIGRLFQDPLRGTAPSMTIRENLALAYLRAGNTKWFARITDKENDFYHDQLAKLGIGLEERMDVPVGTLSGGQRQSLTLLMATIVPPKLLLLDEHTAALDPRAADQTMHLTKQIVSEHNITCLMITHNLHQALETGNRTLMMRNGQIVLDVSGKERDSMNVDDLLSEFHKVTNEDLDNDRILLAD